MHPDAVHIIKNTVRDQICPQPESWETNLYSDLTLFYKLHISEPAKQRTGG